MEDASIVNSTCKKSRDCISGKRSRRAKPPWPMFQQTTLKSRRGEGDEPLARHTAATARAPGNATIAHGSWLEILTQRGGRWCLYVGRQALQTYGRQRPSNLELQRTVICVPPPLRREEADRRQLAVRDHARTACHSRQLALDATKGAQDLREPPRSSIPGMVRGALFELPQGGRVARRRVISKSPAIARKPGVDLAQQIDCGIAMDSEAPRRYRKMRAPVARQEAEPHELREPAIYTQGGDSSCKLNSVPHLRATHRGAAFGKHELQLRQ